MAAAPLQRNAVAMSKLCNKRYRVGCDCARPDPEVHDPEVHDPEVHDPEVHGPRGSWTPRFMDPEVHDPEVHDPEVHDPEVPRVRLLDSHLTKSTLRLFQQRSPRALLTPAACGGLMPAPARRHRGACPHRWYSIASIVTSMVAFVAHNLSRILYLIVRVDRLPPYAFRIASYRVKPRDYATRYGSGCTISTLQSTGSC
jgi:hypothetical protein